MRILYFDGHCNLCNGFVDFLIRHDRHQRLRFTSLQGETAKTRLPSALVNDLNTVVLEKDGQLLKESSAALNALMSLGGMFSLLAVALLVPPFIRDRVYRAVATRRYKIWGRRETCRLPTDQERSLFLP